MKPRITISLRQDGELEIFVNESGRDLLLAELSHLSRDSDHFHLGVGEHSEVELQPVAYKDGETLIEQAKVMFRPDDWDREYFPHVMADAS